MENGRKLSRQEWRAQQRAEAKKLTKAKREKASDSEITRALAYIDADIARRKIKKSPSELALWPQYYDSIPEGKALTTPEDVTIASRKVGETARAMGLSENPFFTRTIQGIERRIRTGDLMVESVINFSANRQGAMAVMPDYVDEGQTGLIWVLGVSLEAVTHRPNGVSIAGHFVHEMEHIQRGEAFFSDLGPDIPAIEQIERYEEYHSNPENRLQEEAFAEAQQSESFIYQMGLGYDDRVEIAQILQAGKYLEIGRNPRSPVWKHYLQSIEEKRL